MYWEAEALFWIQDNLTCGFMDFLMTTVSLLCTGNLLWFAIAGILICRKDTRRIGFTLALAFVISMLVCNVTLKPMIERVRPFEEYGVTLIIPEPSDYSFPSGHTVGVTVMTTVLLKHFRKYGYAMAVFAVSVMFSRIYLFVHYPTDIIGGIVIGLISVLLSYVIIEHIYRRKGNTTYGIQRVQDEEGT